MLVRKIAIGADHRGFKNKQLLIENGVDDLIIEWIDCGAFAEEKNDDYPIFAKKVVESIKKLNLDGGVLLCGSGAGMAIAANRNKGVFAAVAWDKEIARRVREEDNCSILVLPSDYVSFPQAQECVKAWLTASFNRDRYEVRLSMIDEY